MQIDKFQEKCKWIAYTLDSILGITGRVNSLTPSRIQTYVEAHVESLRDVYLELSQGEHLKVKDGQRQLTRTKLQKNNFDPILCQSEFLLSDPIDCYLLPSTLESEMAPNRLENVLPAGGSLFLTNYRVIFKGKSVDINGNLFYEKVVYYVLNSFSYKRHDRPDAPSLLGGIFQKVKLEEAHSSAAHWEGYKLFVVLNDKDSYFRV